MMRKSLRIKKRSERIAEKRFEKLKNSQADYSYDNIFTLNHFVIAFFKCLKGVLWKASVQNYLINCVTKLFSDYLSIKNRKLPKPVSDKEIIIRERGKPRKITPIHIKDRVIQKVLCDFGLVPILSKVLIYDNGASLEDKGVRFSRNRMLHHIKNAIKKYGTTFYILSFDFKDFFNSIPHKTCQKVLERYIYDKDVINITMEIIKSPYKIKIMKIKDKSEREEQLQKLERNELRGICLGSQVSQIIALVIANDIDHYIKDICKFDFYERYMDDGIVLARTKEELRVLFENLKARTDKLGLNFNIAKTHIIKSSKGFTFLKVTYFVTETGKIVRKLNRKGIVRQRRKLKKFKCKLKEKCMTLENVYDSAQSWFEHAQIADSYITQKEMTKLYNILYDGYKITKKWKHLQGGKNVKKIQVNKLRKYRWNCVC